MVTERVAAVACGLALGSGDLAPMAASTPAASRIVDVPPPAAAEQADAASKATNPAIAQAALTVSRMRINLAWYSRAWTYDPRVGLECAAERRVTGMRRVTTGERAPETVNRLLRSLPEWFGIESSIVEYVAKASELPTYLAWPAGF